MANVMILIAAFLFAAYFSVSVIMFGVPDSLSETHYLWSSKWPKAGKFIFPSWMVTFAGLLLPSVLTKTEVNQNFQFVAFAMVASLLFVAAAPCFKSASEKKVHTISAYCSALFGIAYCVIYGSWAVPLFFAALASGAAVKNIRLIVLCAELVAFCSVIMCMI